MAPIKKLGRPKKIKAPDYKVPFKMIQEIKFEIYSRIPIGKKVYFIDDNGIERQGKIVGAILSHKTKVIKEYIINNVDTGYTGVYGPNEYIPEEFLKPKQAYYAREIKNGRIYRAKDKRVGTCRIKN